MGYIRDFYARDTEEVAKDLLGTIFVKEINNTILKGRIVETEAYYGQNDPASHASNGKTNRNKIMYGEPGKLYVYLCYGMYNLMNVVTEENNEPGAVLIRGIEPLEGMEIMKSNRGRQENLTNGPGRLTEAFGIDRDHNGVDLVNSKIYIEKSDEDIDIGRSSRIGINEGDELLLRFYLKDNPFVSK